MAADRVDEGDPLHRHVGSPSRAGPRRKRGAAGG